MSVKRPPSSGRKLIRRRLCHIVIGPHNNSFHKLWKDLRDEWSSLQLKGYTGEGFLGKGRKLGGRGGKVPPLHEIRRQARAAAEKRKVLNQGSGQRLGGRPLPRGMEREAIAAAAARRATITKGCASGTKEAGKMAEEASRDGFRTKAEEDDANDRAIAEALAELWEEEEERKLYGPGSAGDGGLVWTAESGLEMNEPSTRPPGQPSRAPQQPTTRKGRPISRLVAEAEDKKSANVASASNPQRGSADSSNSTSQQTIPPSTNRDLWSCEICTLENPWNYLCCDACGVERPSSIIPLRGSGSSGRDTISSSSSRSTVQGLTQPKPREEPLGWVCSHCGAFMERQWWTCSACGRMKDSS